MKDRLDILAADLEPYRGRTVGSLRIGMDEVQKILALLDASRAQPVAVTETPSNDTQSPLLSADDHQDQDQAQPIDDEALVERLRDKIDEWIGDFSTSEEMARAILPLIREGDAAW